MKQLVIESERSEHTVVTALIFVYILRVPAITENYGESRMRASESCFHLVLLLA